MPELTRYLIGVAMGAAIGALAVWQWAHDDADRVLRDWESAVVDQRAAEKRRTDKLNQETVRGLLDAHARLRARLDAGWRPTIPAAAGVSADRIPGAAGGTDAGAADVVPGAGGSAPADELATCTAERARLISDGADATLQLLHLQAWVFGVGFQAMQPKP